MSLALLLASAVAAAPPDDPHATGVAVLVVRRTSLPADEARTYAEAVAAALRAAGVAVEEPAESLRRLKVLGVDDPAVCAGRKACVLELARQLEVAAVVSVSAAALQQERSIALDAVRVAGGTSMAKDAAVLKAGAPLPPESLKAISRALAAAFPARAAPQPRPKDTPPDAPIAEARQVTPAPQVKPEAPAAVTAPAAPPEPVSHTAAFVTGGLAVAAAVSAVALGGVALSMRAQSTTTTTVNGEQISALPASRAKELAGQANTFGAAAGGVAGLAVVLGVVAVISW